MKAPVPARIEPTRLYQSEGHPHYIVGIGASAGGLEALELFLKNVPPHSGLVFVIIQHQDPTHKGILVELLQRITAIPVLQVAEGMKVEPDCIYVIPPNKDMSILHGTLHLFEPIAPRGLRLPIDFFFRSLADDQRESSIGVVLSGMGSDGTLGLKAIKEKNGMILVQEPSSAKLDGMPSSAVNTGLVDIVATAEELPGKIIDYLNHTPYIAKSDPILGIKSKTALEKVLILLRTQTGHDFSLYKKATIYRRLERRMGIHQIDDIATYVRFAQENHQEIRLLFYELLIGVTSFFRDSLEWELLKDDVLPTLLETHGGILRAWAPGCATGEEAYSLAMIFRETVAKYKPSGNHSLQIFATDINEETLRKARSGVYNTNIAVDVSTQRLSRFFVQHEHGYQVTKDIREMVVFAPHNIAMDPPFTKLDILICRNLLIYLDQRLQKKLLPLFYYCLNPDGLLFLGSAETVGTYTNLFSPLNDKTRLYRRRDSALLKGLIEFPSSFIPRLLNPQDSSPVQIERQIPAPDLQLLVNQLLLQHYSPTAVLTSDKGDILYISGKTGKYLEPASGHANWNIFAMAREGLHHELNNAFWKVLHQKEPVIMKNLKVSTNGGVQAVDITVQLLTEHTALPNKILIVFTDTTTPVAVAKIPGDPIPAHDLTCQVELEEQLKLTREELQATREEAQTAQEELSSMNEELQSANEELQSTNEELTTSREELQSLNEELHTINYELRAKVNELSRINNDMANLLNSTNIATLFLDEDLSVRRFTPQTTTIIKLINSDTGRLVTDIANNLDYPTLADDAREVLRTLVFKEKQVFASDKRCFTIRIMPYRTLDNRIDGLVITFTDITVSKQLEYTLRENEDRLFAVIEGNCVIVADVDKELRYTWLHNPLASSDEVNAIGKRDDELVDPSEAKNIMDIKREAWVTGKAVRREYTTKTQTDTRYYDFIAKPIKNTSGDVVKLVTAGIDITERRRAEKSLRESKESLHTLFNTMTHGVVLQDVDGRILMANPAAEHILGLSSANMQGKALTDPLWKFICEDNSVCPSDKYPCVVASQTGEVIKGVTLGVHNNSDDQNHWVVIDALPLLREGETHPYQVYTLFTDITALWSAVGYPEIKKTS